MIVSSFVYDSTGDISNQLRIFCLLNFAYLFNMNRVEHNVVQLLYPSKIAWKYIVLKNCSR